MYPDRKPTEKPWNGAYGDDDDTDQSPFSVPETRERTPMGDGAYGDEED